MVFSEVKFQIGKKGLTDEFIATLDNALKSHNQLRISVLKSAGRDSKHVKEIADEISSKLSYKNAVKVIGFTIIVRKLSRQPIKDKQ